MLSFVIDKPDKNLISCSLHIQWNECLLFSCVRFGVMNLWIDEMKSREKGSISNLSIWYVLILYDFVYLWVCGNRRRRPNNALNLNKTISIEWIHCVIDIYIYTMYIECHASFYFEPLRMNSCVVVSSFIHVSYPFRTNERRKCFTHDELLINCEHR